jgi:hypothetical protein
MAGATLQYGLVLVVPELLVRFQRLALLGT